MEYQPRNRMLTEEEYAKFLTVKDAKREAVFNLMCTVNTTLVEAGRTTGAEIFRGWKDINSYFPGYNNGTNTLHVRLSSVENNKRKLTITMRELDSRLMEEERKRVSLGLEYDSVVRTVLEPTLISGTPSSVIRLLKNELPEPKH
jgi:hypothetical protein